MDRFCEDKQRLMEYLDGRLTDEERRDYEMHLSDCPRCRSELLAMHAELNELGLSRVAREALARRAASELAGERTTAAERILAGIKAFLPVRNRRLATAASVAALAAVIVIAGALFLPKLVPSWDPDLRRGKANLGAILAAADIGDLRLVGGAPSPLERRAPLRGASASASTVFNRTEALLQKAALRHPEDYRAHKLLGDLYLAEGEAERAGNAYRRALLMKQGDPGLLNNLAVAVFRTGDVEESRAYLEQAFTSVDAPAEICYNLAVVWRETGNRDEMKRYLKLYLDKDRGSPWANEARRILTE